jgi:hypothetical protein
MDSLSSPTALNLAFLRRQSTVLEFGAALMGGASAGQIWQDAAAKLVDGSGAARSRVMRYRADTDDLEVCAGMGWSDGMVGSVMSADTTPAGRSFRTALPVLVEDIMNDAPLRAGRTVAWPRHRFAAERPGQGRPGGVWIAGDRW